MRDSVFQCQKTLRSHVPVSKIPKNESSRNANKLEQLTTYTHQHNTTVCILLYLEVN